MNNEYVTTDFWLAAFLKANNFKAIGVRKTSNRTIFVFEDREDRKEVIESFYNDGLIRINSFKHAFQDVKSSIYNFKE